MTFLLNLVVVKYPPEGGLKSLSDGASPVLHPIVLQRIEKRIVKLRGSGICDDEFAVADLWWPNTWVVYRIQ